MGLSQVWVLPLNAINSTLEHQASLQLPSHGTLLFKGTDTGQPDLHAWWLSMDTDHLVDFIGEVVDQGYRLIDQAKSSELCKPRKGSLAA